MKNLNYSSEYDSSKYERVDSDVEVLKEDYVTIKETDVEVVKEGDVEPISSDEEVVEKPDGDINDIFLRESKKFKIPLSKLYLFRYRKLKITGEMTLMRITRLEEDITMCKFSLGCDIRRMKRQLKELKREYNRINRELLDLAFMIFSLECMTCPKSKRLQAIHQNLQRAFKRLDLSTIINNDYCKKCPFYDPHKRVILSLYQKFKRKKKIRPWYGVRGGGYKRRPKSPFRRM